MANEPIEPTGEILFISNKEERLVYINMPTIIEEGEVVQPELKTRVYTPKRGVDDIEIAITVDSIKTSDDISIFINQYLDENYQAVDRIDLMHKLAEYLNKKKEGLYAYQPFIHIEVEKVEQ